MCPADKMDQFCFCPQSVLRLTALVPGVLLANRHCVLQNKIKTEEKNSNRDPKENPNQLRVKLTSTPRKRLAPPCHFQQQPFTSQPPQSGCLTPGGLVCRGEGWGFLPKLVMKTPPLRDSVSLRQRYSINTIQMGLLWFGFFTFFNFTVCFQVNSLHLQFYDPPPPPSPSRNRLFICSSIALSRSDQLKVLGESSSQILYIGCTIFWRHW